MLVKMNRGYACTVLGYNHTAPSSAHVRHACALSFAAAPVQAHNCSSTRVAFVTFDLIIFGLAVKANFILNFYEF